MLREICYGRTLCRGIPVRKVQERSLEKESFLHFFSVGRMEENTHCFYSFCISIREYPRTERRQELGAAMVTAFLPFNAMQHVRNGISKGQLHFCSQKT